MDLALIPQAKSSSSVKLLSCRKPPAAVARAFRWHCTALAHPIRSCSDIGSWAACHCQTSGESVTCQLTTTHIVQHTTMELHCSLHLLFCHLNIALARLKKSDDHKNTASHTMNYDADLIAIYLSGYELLLHIIAHDANTCLLSFSLHSGKEWHLHL